MAIIDEAGADLQAQRIDRPVGLGAGSASNTESRPAPRSVRRAPSAGAVNGRYNPRARVAARVGLDTPALRIFYHTQPEI